jgi:hypothetical protein
VITALAVAERAMSLTASARGGERQTLIARPTQRVSDDAATEYFEADSRELWARRRFFALSVFTLLGACLACVGLTVDMLTHTQKMHVHPGARLGAKPAHLPVWTPNLPLEQVNTPALAFAEMDQVRLEGAALEAAKADSYENSFPSFSSDRYFTVGGNRTRRKLETPVYVIALADSKPDLAKADSLKAAIVRSFSESPNYINRTHEAAAQAKKLVQTQDGVNAAAWPHTIELATEALEGLEELRPTNHMSWFANLAAAKQHDGLLPRAVRGISHHVGCLFSHMRMWRLHQKLKNKWTVIFESDGLWSGLHIPPKGLQSVIDNAPANADVIFLKTRDEPTGQFVKQWPVEDEMIYMYSMNRVQAACGLAGYIVGPKFTEKLYKQIIYSGGADMVDAWLINHICSVRDPTVSGEGGRKNKLNCYHAQGGPPKAPHIVGGYLPEWYGKDKTARTTDDWAKWLKAEKNDAEYNKGRMARVAAWRNGAELHKFGARNDEMLRQALRLQAKRAKARAAAGEAATDAASPSTH